jgi:hypothetical protein
MKPFKFLKTNKPFLSNNILFGVYNADEILIEIIKRKYYMNQEIIDSDFPIEILGIGISNCWLRITEWRTYTNTRPEKLDIYYKIIEVNNSFPYEFKCTMYTHEFLRTCNLA